MIRNMSLVGSYKHLLYRVILLQKEQLLLNVNITIIIIFIEFEGKKGKGEERK